MKKHILSFVFLTVLALAFRASAAPNDAPSSTEQADRQFLQDLERADATKTRPAPSTAAPARTSSPVAPEAGKSDPASAAAPSTAVVKKPRTIVLADDYDQYTQPDAVADFDARSAEEPPPATTHVVVVRPPKGVHPERHSGERHPLHRLLGRLLNFHPEDW